MLKNQPQKDFVVLKSHGFVDYNMDKSLKNSGIKDTVKISQSTVLHQN